MIALVLAGHEFADAASRFERALALSRAVLALEDDAASELEANIREIGRSTVLSTLEAAEHVASIARPGMSVGEATAALSRRAEVVRRSWPYRP